MTTSPLLIAKNADQELFLLPAMANRHGLITGATGTGKTVTLQSLAESFSRSGVPVFLSDIKGDLSGLCKMGGGNEKVTARVAQLKLDDFAHRAYPVTFWDVFGEMGHPVRATVSDMGPQLIGRMLNLNDVQQGVLTLVFKIADDDGLLLLDFKDLRSMVQHVGENAKTFTTEYGNVSAASIGAIQRGLLELEAQGAERAYALVRDELRRTPTLLGLDKLLEAQLLEAPVERRRDLELIKELVHQHTRGLAMYKCDSCGFRARQFYWHCPACAAWETYSPRRTEEKGLPA